MSKSYVCATCIYNNVSIDDVPCSTCIHSGSIGRDYTSNYKLIIKMPPVKDEINHPDRYAGGKFECIDVMIDVFGVEAVKAFCKLNAFKYLWREEHKGGTEDLKKAVWYINECIKLSESGSDDEQ